MNFFVQFDVSDGDAGRRLEFFDWLRLSVRFFLVRRMTIDPFAVFSAARRFRRFRWLFALPASGARGARPMLRSLLDWRIDAVRVEALLARATDKKRILQCFKREHVIIFSDYVMGNSRFPLSGHRCCSFCIRSTPSRPLASVR